MKLALLLFALSIGTILSQDLPDDYSAIGTAGNKKITKLDFLERFEFSPSFDKHNTKNMNSSKSNLILSLISEKLWALEAESLNLDSSKAITVSAHLFENMFIRDLLYKKKVREGAQFSNEEFSEARRRQNLKYYVKYVFSEDSAEVADIYSVLQKGANFDTILSAREEISFQPNPEEVVYGQLANHVEDELFKLTIYMFTPPLPTPAGWYIFYVENLEQKIDIAPVSETDNTSQLALKVLKTRKENEQYFKYLAQFYSNKIIKADAELMKCFSVHLTQVLQNKKHVISADDTTAIHLTAAEVISLLNSIPPDTLKMIVCRIDDTKINLNDFILYFSFDGFHISNPNLNPVFTEIQKRMRSTIENELIANEGRKNNYNNDPEVIRQVSMWKDNYLYQILRNTIADSIKISDEEAIDFYTKNYKDYVYPRAVNIIEMFTDSLTLAESALSELKNGADFKQTVKKYNKKKEISKKDGEYGLFPVERLGTLGEIAWDMSINEVRGPIQNNNGYSIIKLLDKREKFTEKNKKSFVEIKEQLKSEIVNRKVKHKLDVKTVTLAKKYGFSVNSDMINSMETTSVNSFGVRKLGFGGQITAVPLLAPDNDWIFDFTKQTGLTP